MLTVYSYIEFYLTLLAWIVNNGVFEVLRDTGVAAWPIAAIIFSQWLQAREEGADEGNKALLTVYRVENKVYVAYLVILFAFVPAIDVTLTEFRPDTDRSSPCVITRYTPEQQEQQQPGSPPMGQRFEDHIQSIGGQNARIPVWWALVHALSKGITQAAAMHVPCTPDIRQILVEVDEMAVRDKFLVRELRDFTHDCYARARDEIRKDKRVLSSEQLEDIGWVGSNFLQQEYYPRYRSHEPRSGWRTTDAMFLGRPRLTDKDGQVMAYPDCLDWWNGDGQMAGLHARLLADMGTGMLDEVMRVANIDPERASGEERKRAEDLMMRRVIRPEQIQRTNPTSNILPRLDHTRRSDSGEAAAEVVGGIGNFFTNVGLGLGLGVLLTGLNALRSALPMMQAFILMAIIMALPLLLVIGKYQLSVVISVTFAMFAVHFCSFWWELARWIDSSLWSALFGAVSGPAMIGASIPITDTSVSQLVLQFVMAALFFVLPTFFLSMMGWAGVKIGGAISNALSGGTASSKSAGGSGASLAISAASKGMASGKSGKSGKK